MTEILQSALDVAKFGFRSLPVHRILDGECSCNNPVCKKQGKHPKLRRWQHLATKDEVKLEELFAVSDSNLGIATGSKSNLVVLDVDPKNGGNESYRALTKKFGALDEHTLVANTGGGGLHLYYNSDSKIIGSHHSTVFGHGIDIKGNGGFIVGAPSNHISGQEYYWRDGFYMPAALPIELEQELLRHTTRRRNLKQFDKKDITQGERNTTLTRIAGRYRAKALSFNTINMQLQVDNIDRCKPPLDRYEVEAIARSISKYPIGHLRSNFRDFWVACIFSDQTKLDIGTKSVLMALSFLMDEHGGNCTAPQTLISKKAGCSRPTASKHLNKAQKLGWLKIFHLPKTNGERGIYCRYIANIPIIQ